MPSLFVAQMKLHDLVQKLGGEAVGEVALPLAGVATIEAAQPDQITFLANPKYRGKLAQSRAGAVIVAPGDRDATTAPRIVTVNPYAYFARVAQLFNPAPVYPPGVHASSVIHRDAEVAPSASIAEFVSIGARAVIGAAVRIGPGCHVGDGAVIGTGTRLEARVTVYHDCRIGANCIVHSGAVIGADGFGFAQDEGAWVKIPQTGGVTIGDDVEIGANTTIDRGALDDTVIGNGVKLDNQIQIGHNVVVGDHTVIAGCVGVAGSARIGKHCQIGGAARILGHLEIADGCQISVMTLISKSISVPGTYTSVMPFMVHAEWLRNAAHIRHLARMADQLDHIGKQKK
jgi:UDP-3-O-[3-hydroxymyristoyl] glucosamine N-acyltransferase